MRVGMSPIPDGVPDWIVAAVGIAFGVACVAIIGWRLISDYLERRK